MRLSDLKTGQRAIILKVLGHGGFRRRIMEMGFVRGKEVEVLQNAPLRDPINYRIMDYEVSLRRSEAAMIEVLSEQETRYDIPAGDSVTLPAPEAIERAYDASRRQINVALVGNPNSGKTSLFNSATGSHAHVGNYGGVTVDVSVGRFDYGGYRFVVYDLPGTYALSPYTPEELFVRRHIVERTPDVIVNVVAASNLERNLFLTTELIDMNQPLVVALNMYDELEQSGATLDYVGLGNMLGVPMIPTVSRSGKGLDHLFEAVIRVYEGQEPSVRHIHIAHGPIIENAVAALTRRMKADALPEPTDGTPAPEHTFARALRFFPPRFMALKLLEGDIDASEMLSDEPAYPAWTQLRDDEARRIEMELGEDVETAVTNAKYGFIAGALRETYTPGPKGERDTTNRIDAVVTHKLFGFPIFLLLMWAIFAATFQLGNYPMEWIESGISALGSWVGGILSDGPLRDLLVDGVIGGVGGVIVFLPNILILYFFISFMEDSGYMARAAFIMDRIMHRIGLHGKSFIPLIMGFGCNVPAIVATRSIESRSSRLITILINPFMSCSARLPVFLLLAGTFFPHGSGTVLFSLYLLGIVVAVFTAKLLRRTYFKADETPFVMELPPYRMPTARSTVRHMWDKAAQYLRKMGGLILLASIAVWFLSYFPRHDDPVQQQEQSYLGRLGHVCEPLVAPLGFDWKASVSLLAGTAAKEVIVSTMGVIYAGDDSGETLPEKLTTVDPETGQAVFTPVTALAFLVFVLLYFPCWATLAAIRSETGGRRWVLFTIVYNTAVAWLLAFLVHTIGNLFF